MENASAYGNSYPVAIDFIADNGRVFSRYPVHHTTQDQYRAWLEAVNGERYKIRIHNLTNKRIGLVIAVDGRNIISGQRSSLQAYERMYILNPFQQSTFEGWRTGSNQVHRFYFTYASDSYAGSWDDYSAMGVIAVAVFDENRVYQYRGQKRLKRDYNAGKNRSAPSTEFSVAEDEANAPGTGFGKEVYSPVKLVNFRPSETAIAKYFFKYDWRETLCKKRIINCYSTPNRFWPKHEEYGYVPYPPY